MSSSLLEMLGQQLDTNAVQQMSGQLGVDSATTSKAISAALPMLMGSLAKNAAQPQGAQALAGALDRDHDGSVLDDVAGFLGQGNQAQSMGAGILGHILGNKQQGAASAVGAATGLDSGKAGQLLAMLAPLVLGALGRQKRSGGMDAGSLAGMLARERQQVERSQPQAASMLSQFLDQDGDGQIGDDLANMGMKVLGNFLGGGRR